MNKEELLDLAMSAVESDDSLGYCLKCGTEHCCIEPDARNYECEGCGKLAVFGAEEIVLILA